MTLPTVITRDWCNIFGRNEVTGAERYMGGLGDASQVSKQWYCPTRMVGRFVMVCAHGHKGRPMKLCRRHLQAFSDVQFCPRCNQDPNGGHRCHVKLEPVT